MSTPHKDQLPQVAYGEGPEVFNPHQHQSILEPQHVQPEFVPAPPKKSGILGLPRQTFWLCLILLVVVIAAAVGGGVGGTLAVQNAKSVT